MKINRRTVLGGLIGTGATLAAGPALAAVCTDKPAEQGNVTDYDQLIPVAQKIFELKDSLTNSAGVLDHAAFTRAIPEFSHIPTEEGGVQLGGYNDWNASGLQHAVEAVANARMQQAWDTDFENIIAKDLPADGDTTKAALSASAAFIRTRPIGEGSYPSVGYREAVARAVETGTLTQFQENLRAQRDLEIREVKAALDPTLDCIIDRNARLTK